MELTAGDLALILGLVVGLFYKQAIKIVCYIWQKVHPMSLARVDTWFRELKERRGKK
jgi:type IV secretory pathway TrbD component